MLVSNFVMESNLSRLHGSTQLPRTSVSRRHLSLNELLLGGLAKHLSDKLAGFALTDRVVDVSGKNSSSRAAILSYLLLILRPPEPRVEDLEEREVWIRVRSNGTNLQSS